MNRSETEHGSSVDIAQDISDSNDDMLMTEEQAADSTVSFKVHQDAVPKRGWTKNEIRGVWIAAAVITVLVIIGTIFLNSLGILSFKL